MRTHKKIKSLVIGLGNIGLNYDIGKKKEITTHCKALSLDKSYELIGAIDKDLNKIRIFNKIYNKPGFKSVRKALKFTKPELIVISCNTEYHYNIFEKIKKFQNLKYILLEKPGTLNLSDLKKIFVFCKKKNIKIYLNYFRLFDNYYINIAKKIKKNKYSEIFIFYNRGILNNCGHFISFINLFAGNFKKVKILKVYKEKKIDYEADFQLIYQKAKINFFRNNIKKLINLKIIINGNKSNWTSLKNFNEFVFCNTSQDLFLKENKNYTNEKLVLNNNIQIPQSIVYKKILKINKQEEKAYTNNSIKTLKILNNIFFEIKKFNKTK
jgi:hypothetical protein